ncbi:type II toxin-antitoxin system ParD family antitoxin [Neptunicella sp. SCSIO 80796]|uniref:type II toxin-antitoxin system ParD family antitoxin n=1 Tax=Neptunicella plasticusilytica TaxID=3117012 RepID=UPI003A4DA912
MNLNITPELEQFIRERTASGDYNNASEVVREALRLLKRQEAHYALSMENLRGACAVGDNAIANGDFVELNSATELNAFFAKL